MEWFRGDNTVFYGEDDSSVVNLRDAENLWCRRIMVDEGDPVS